MALRPPQRERINESDPRLSVDALGAAQSTISLALSCAPAQLWTQSTVAAIVREGEESTIPTAEQGGDSRLCHHSRLARTAGGFLTARWEEGGAWTPTGPAVAPAPLPHRQHPEGVCGAARLWPAPGLSSWHHSHGTSQPELYAHAAAKHGRHGHGCSAGCEPGEPSTKAPDGSSKPPGSRCVSVTFGVEGEVKPKPQSGQNPQTASTQSWCGRAAAVPPQIAAAKGVTSGPRAPWLVHADSVNIPPVQRHWLGNSDPRSREGAAEADRVVQVSVRSGKHGLPGLAAQDEEPGEHRAPVVSSRLKCSNISVKGNTNC